MIRLKKLMLAAALILLSGVAHATLFVVTSNADSGPGTLRDALTKAAANGSAVTDMIYFKLPGTTLAEHTITILSPLPNVSSNVQINGSSQSGATLPGMGNAHVNITVDPAQFTTTKPYAAALVLDQVTDVVIYGLAFEGFQNLSGISAGIYVNSSQNITIGVRLKGCYFYNDSYGLYVTGTTAAPSANLLITASYFGYLPGSTTLAPADVYISANSTTFGSYDTQEGNYLLGTIEIEGQNDTILRNYFGLDNAWNPIPGSNPTIKSLLSSTDGLVINLSWPSALTIDLENIHNFKVLENVDRGTRTALTPSITMINCQNGAIGGPDIVYTNLFHGNGVSPAIVNINSTQIEMDITRIICSGLPYSIDQATYDLPGTTHINLLVSNNGEFSGTTSPGATVFIYEDDSDCPVCNPVNFITQIRADGNGNWKYTGDFTGKKLIASSLANHSGSEFSGPQILDVQSNLVYTDASCGNANGSITLTHLRNVLNVEWYDASTNQKIGDGVTKTGLAPGTYYAKGISNNCHTTSATFTIKDISPQIKDDQVQKINPSCGMPGAIRNLTTTTNSTHTATYVWTDQNNQIVSHSKDAEGLTAGQFTLTMTDDVTHCSTTYGPVTLQGISSGASINQTHQPVVASAACSSATGSISGVQASGTGTLKYAWFDSSNNPVGSTADLTGVPAGTYKLQVSDDSQCSPAEITVTIPQVNTVSMDESAAAHTDASCSRDDGSITGIRATGATKYQWFTAAGTPVGGSALTADITGLPGGQYYLVASNNQCSQTSTTYTIGKQLPAQNLTVNTLTAYNCPGTTNGYIQITPTDARITGARLEDSQHQPVGPGYYFNNLADGTYYVYLTDNGGCESYYGPLEMKDIALPSIVDANKVISPDQCGAGNGSIKNITINNPDASSPYQLQWLAADGSSAGTTLDITGLKAGTYTLQVQGAYCAPVSKQYTIEASNETIASPTVKDVQLCSAGAAGIAVESPVAGYTYKLYADAQTTTPLDVQTSGKFTINLKTSGVYYISQADGSCESSRTAVQVTIGLSLASIANTFTPNGDGINDTWQIAGIGNYPQADVQVFNRFGQRVFESKGYSTPFDGTSNGRQLPVGAYYFIIKLNNSCNVLSGSVAIIR